MNIEKKGNWLIVSVPKDWNGFTIEKILKEIWQVPRQMLHEFRMEKSVKKNGNITPWNEIVSVGDTLQLRIFNEEEYGVIPEYIDIQILYEDEHLLIANKPAGMDTHPNESGQTGTLANAIASHLQSNGWFSKVRHIHRLDKDTTGCVLFAKNKLAATTLDRNLEKREIKRTYVALVHGLLKNKSGEIQASIGRDRHHPTRRRVSPSGQKAITHYKVVQTFPSKQMTLIELELQTGRTHQIRVHMSYIGHPLIGDTLYGGKPIVKRQALHAAKIKLLHPITNEIINVEAPFLDDPPIFPL